MRPAWVPVRSRFGCPGGVPVWSRGGPGEVPRGSRWWGGRGLPTHLSPQVLEYNAPGGKYNRGLTVLAAFRELAGPQQQDPESLRCALAVGWCIELVRAGHGAAPHPLPLRAPIPQLPPNPAFCSSRPFSWWPTTSWTSP